SSRGLDVTPACLDGALMRTKLGAERAHARVHDLTSHITTRRRFPEPEASGDASRVVDDRGLRTQVDVEVHGVATADVEVVEEEQGVDVADRLPNPLVPLLLAHPLASGVADLLVVGLALAERVMGQLDVR